MKEQIIDKINTALEEMGWIYDELPYECDGQCYCGTVCRLLRDCLELLE